MALKDVDSKEAFNLYYLIRDCQELSNSDCQSCEDILIDLISRVIYIAAWRRAKGSKEVMYTEIEGIEGIMVWVKTAVEYL